jgi:small subunit ribosomal protein S3e
VPLPIAALSASWQAENIKYKLLAGNPVRMVVNQVLNMVKRTGIAQGCQVIIAGKVKGQRAKA